MLRSGKGAEHNSQITRHKHGEVLPVLSLFAGSRLHLEPKHFKSRIHACSFQKLRFGDDSSGIFQFVALPKHGTHEFLTKPGKAIASH